MTGPANRALRSSPQSPTHMTLIRDYCLELGVFCSAAAPMPNSSVFLTLACIVSGKGGDDMSCVESLEPATLQFVECGRGLMPDV